MLNNYLLIILFIIIILILIYDTTDDKEYMFNETDNIKIKFKNSNLPIELYNIIFIDQTKLDMNIIDIIDDLQLSSNKDIILNIICDIINERRKLIDDFKLKQIYLSTFTKQHIQYIYNYNENIDFKDEFTMLSLDIYYTFYDIIHYNNYHSDLIDIVNRHPLLYSYKNIILNMNLNLNTNIKLKLSRNDINNKLNNIDYLSDDIKYILINTLYQNLCIEYKDDDTINIILDKLELNNHDQIIYALNNTLNKYIIYLSPNYKYNINNTTIYTINNIITNLAYYRNYNYLKKISAEEANILLLILYKKYDLLDYDLINKLNILLKLNTLKNIDEIRFEQLENVIIYNINIKNIKTIIKKNHTKLPYNMLTNITNKSNMKEISNMVLFGYLLNN